MNDQRGIPISIYRPGRITGHSQTGAWQENDFLWQMIVASLRLRTFPDLDSKVDMTPVDYVGRAIVALSLQARCLGNNFHLINLPPVHLRQLAEWMRSLSYELDIVSYGFWQEKLVALGRQKPSNMASSMALLLAESPLPWHLSDCDCWHVQDGLKETGITCPAADVSLLHRYISSFVDRGVIEVASLYK